MALMEKAKQLLDRVIAGPVEDAGGQVPVTLMETGERRGFKPAPPARHETARQGAVQGFQQAGQTGFQQATAPQAQESAPQSASAAWQTDYQQSTPWQQEVPYAAASQPQEETATPWWKGVAQRVRSRRRSGGQDVQDAVMAEAYQQPGYQAQPAVQIGYQAQPAMQTGYQAQPAVQTGYQAQPAMQTGYQAQPAMQTGYQAQPVMQTGYQAQPAVQTGYQAQQSFPQTGFQMQQPATQPYGQPQLFAQGAQAKQAQVPPAPERRSRRSRNNQQQAPEQEDNNLRYMNENHFVDENGTAYTMLVRLAQPTATDKCYRLIEFMSNGETVLVNLEAIRDTAEQDRCLDLLYGAAHALQYSYTKLAERCLVMFSPRDVGVKPYNALNQMSQRDAARRWPGSDPTNPEDHTFDRGYDRNQRQAAGGFGSAFRGAPEFRPAEPRGRYGTPTRFY